MDFSITRNSDIVLSFRLQIIQSAVDVDLLLAIQNYINSLPYSFMNTFDLTIITGFQNKRDDAEGVQRNYVGLYSSTNKKIAEVHEKYHLAKSRFYYR